MENLTRSIIALERAALEQWNAGNPSGYLELYTSDVTYFDPYFERRMDGLEAVSEYYESIRGQIRVKRYEMVNPSVQPIGESGAVLTYNLVSLGGDGNLYKWNCTQVYRMENENWKIAHNHWAFTTPSAR